jgi:hypothetical protein
MTRAEGKAGGPIAPLPTSVPSRPGKNSVALPETTEANPWVSNHEIKKESNPFTDKDWRMLAYAWFGLLVRIILVFGALFSVYQFLEAREEKRVERSLELVELWEKDEYQSAERALKKRLADLNAKYVNLLGDKPSATDRAVYFERIGIEALSDEGGTMPLQEFQEHFDQIVYFLNRMSFCIEGDLCSRDVADAYFRDYAVSFWSYFSGYVARQRKAGSSTYALPIENYVLRDLGAVASQ